MLDAVAASPWIDEDTQVDPVLAGLIEMLDGANLLVDEDGVILTRNGQARALLAGGSAIRYPVRILIICADR